MTDDHDILIAIKTDIKWLKAQFGNHLKHHAAINICLVGAVLTAITAILVLVLRS